jgi:hypothetical protein
VPRALTHRPLGGRSARTYPYPQKLGATLARPGPRTGDRQRMTLTEALMATFALLLALSLAVVVFVITATDLGWAGAFLFLAGFLIGLVTPRRG